MSDSEENSVSDEGEVVEQPPKEKKNNKRKKKQKQELQNAGAQKKSKTESPKTPAIAPKDSSDDSDGNDDTPAASVTSSQVPKGTILDLGRDYHARINEFKGKTYLDFRGYYTAKGSNEPRPGNKGISFTPVQWALIKKNIPLLDKALAKALE